MKRFLQRGGTWVLTQDVLLGGVVLLAIIYHAGRFHPAAVAAGAALLFIGAGVSLAGVLTLGRNLTPFPQPTDRGQLVRHGIYRLIRHPLYTAIMAAALGWALVWQSWPTVGIATVLVPFFHAKTRREEQWLRQKFTDYAAYQQQVPRFLPRWPPTRRTE